MFAETVISDFSVDRDNEHLVMISALLRKDNKVEDICQ